MKFKHEFTANEHVWTLTVASKEFNKVHAGFTEEEDEEGLDLLNTIQTVGELDMSLISVIICGVARMALEVEKNEIPPDSALAKITEASQGVVQEATLAYIKAIKDDATGQTETTVEPN